MDHRTSMSSIGAYSPDKAACHPDRVESLRAGRQPYPIHLHMVISDLCDLDCPKCSYRSSGYSSNQLFGVTDSEGKYTHNPNRQLPTEQVFGILDDFAAMGGRACEITGGGETTIHPDCSKILGYAQTLGIKTALVTNGLHLRKPAILYAATACQWVRISIDASTPRTYGKVRPSLGAPRGENLYECLSALTRLRTIRDAKKLDCTIGAGFVVQKENWEEMYDACKLYRDAGADNIRISGAFTVEKDRYFDGWREPAEELERAAVRDFSRPSLGFTVHGRMHEKVTDLTAAPTVDRCWYEEFTTYIGGDGNLYRCCVTSYNLHGLIGNLREAGGFKALWDSKLKQEKFDSFSAKSCSFCQFNDRLLSIESLVKSTGPIVVPTNITHPDFV